MGEYFEEYVGRFSLLTATEEASRCLLCLDAPCSASCPAGTDPAKFIRSLRFKNVKGAAYTVRINNPLGGVCARVCPTEAYCQKGCTRCGIDKPIDIGRLQRFITDFESSAKMKILEVESKIDKKIALVGSGPSALTIAAFLARKGYQVEIFEKEEKLGGALRYGIPEYRLPTKVLDEEINRIIDLGIKVHLNTYINKEKLEELKKDFDAVVLASGYSKAKVLDIFKDNKYVITALDLLKRIKENKIDLSPYKTVITIGGGDVTMDVVTSLKLKRVPRVIDVIYEEATEFRASKKELDTARELGVSLLDGFIPVEVKENEVSFKHRFVESSLKVRGDLIVLGIGQEIENDFDLQVEKGEIKAENYRVKDNLFVSGDLSRNDKSVVGCVRAGKEAAQAIDAYLGGKF